MSINVANVEKEHIILDFTGRIQRVENAWNNMLKKVKEDGKKYFVVELIVPSGQGDKQINKPQINVVVEKENLYVVGIEKSQDTYIEFKQEDIAYTKYDKEVYLDKNKIADDVRKIAKEVDSMETGKNLLDNIDNYYAFVHVVFLVSEAARFEFVRTAVKRILGYLSPLDIKENFMNVPTSNAFYNCCKMYHTLLTDYGKIFVETNAGNNAKLHSEVLSTLSCRKYYLARLGKVKLDDLQKIGLLNADQCKE